MSDKWVENNDRIATVCDVEICIFCECGKIFSATMSKDEEDFAECPDCGKRYKVTATVYEES